MDRDNLRALAAFRSTQAGPLENSLLDAYFPGGLDRGRFLRRASHGKLSPTAIGAALSAMGPAVPALGAPPPLRLDAATGSGDVTVHRR